MSVKIGFAGDFCPWLRIEQAVLKGQKEHLFSSILPHLKSNHTNVIDLECPLTKSTNKIEKTGPHIKASPETGSLLPLLNVKVVATANNHFKDYGEVGIKSTYDVLSSVGVDYLGSGTSKKEASKYYVLEYDNTKIALINVTDQEWSIATENEADFVVVIAHGGDENVPLPSPRIKKWFRFFIDAGASAVVGHHTHVISGYEVYNNAPIFYGLGNFCFDWEDKRNNNWNYGLLLNLQFDKSKSVGYSYEVFEQNNDKAGVHILSKENQEIWIDKIKNFNTIINDDEKLMQFYKRHIAEIKPTIERWLQPYSGKVFPHLYNRGFLPSLLNRRKKLLITNLVRCDTFRDILVLCTDPTKKN